MIQETDTIFLRNYYRAKLVGLGTKTWRYSGDCWATRIYESDEIEAFAYILSDRKSQLFSPSALLGTLLNQPLTLSQFSKGTSIGVRFPDEFNIIDIGFPEDNDASGRRKYKRKLRKTLERFCWRFLKANRHDPKEVEDGISEYLDHYSEVCNKKE